MASRGGECRTELLALADDFSRLADRYRTLALGLPQGEMDVPIVEGEIEVGHEARLVLDRARRIEVDPDSYGDLAYVHVRMLGVDAARFRDLVRVLDRLALTVIRQYGGSAEGSSWRFQTECRLLDCIAGLLPTAERQRFVAEALGNLGDCEHWWQRVGHLVGLALGTPRLAWMMRREGRRGRV